jgi:hypothetical protein
MSVSPLSLLIDSSKTLLVVICNKVGEGVGITNKMKSFYPCPEELFPLFFRKKKEVILYACSHTKEK